MPYLSDYHGVPKALRLNVAGEPLDWVAWDEAARLYCRTMVVWTQGQVMLHLRGGISRQTQVRSILPIHAIIACKGPIRARDHRQTPLLTNRALFTRDDHTCLYCGHIFPSTALTRDHVTPRHLGGRDQWMNCVTACKRCNHRKGGKSLNETNMKLLALPYKPNRAEYLALINSGRILGEQMQFLRAQFSRHYRSHPETQSSRYAL